jgi:hypothetical protein
VLVLGVTPELCGLPMHVSSRVTAMDKSTDMIGAIWPGRVRARDEVVCADWRWMPLAGSSIDLVLADCPFSSLPYPLGYSALCAELDRVLRRPGRCVVRCYAQTEKRETIDDVFTDLDMGRIGNFHVLKWRLAMALQLHADVGVSVGSVWSALHSAWKDLDLLAERFAWPIEQVRTIESYRNMETRYTFPTFAQYRRIFSAVGLSVIEVSTPSYELGERCPTLVLEPSNCGVPLS